MSGNSLYKMYERMPVWMQNVACSITGLRMRRQRYSDVFHQAFDFLKRSQWWCLEEMKDFQNKLLIKLVRHSYDSVPYYREIFQSLKLTPDDIKSAEDLRNLPLLKKSTVRQRYDELQSRAWPDNRRIHTHTGGTTGTALRLIADIDTEPWQWAVWWRHRDRFGLKVSDPFIVFAGRPVVPLKSIRPPIWRRNFPMSQTYISVHHLTKDNLPVLAEYLMKRKVVYYSGYPSGLYAVACYFLENGKRLPNPPRVVVTGAETLLPHQRQAIKEAFDAEVADQYGASEFCGNISECEHHTYHVDMEFGIIEFVEDKRLPSGCRRIVCTGLYNIAMPLIRYDIGDIATISDRKCSCGRESSTVERIDGRIESYIITPDGRQLGRLDFLFKDTAQIEEAQLVQDDLDHLRIRLVPSSGFTRANEKSLLSDIRSFVGHGMTIEFEYLHEIPRESNGKFRQIVSHVYKDKYAEHFSGFMRQVEGPQQ
jgi:phenylacetate-CoA ligase